MNRRVVVTGLGIVSCLGNNAETVSKALYEGKSGISTRQEHIDMGMRSHVAGEIGRRDSLIEGRPPLVTSRAQSPPGAI